MKRNYSKWCSVALICTIYLFAGIAGWFLFRLLTAQAMEPVWALLLADVLATIVVWAFGLLYENVSVYDPYWSVFPPVAFLLWAFYTGVWSLPVLLLLIASWYWGWRLTRNWVITFKGIGHEDWRYTKYRSLHPLIFQSINLFGLNMMPTLVVFAAMLPGLQLFESASPSGLSGETGLSAVEIQFWWGIWIMYAAVHGIDWYICGAIAMTALFVGISIPLMEKRQLANKPGYAEYRSQSRMLI